MHLNSTCQPQPPPLRARALTQPRAHPDLARLGGHHERREAVVVGHGLQVAVGEEARALEQQQVVHLGDKLGVLAAVVGDGHQRVQHRVAARVLAPHVRLLVWVLRQVFDDVGLVGAGGQRQGQLTCGAGAPTVSVNEPWPTAAVRGGVPGETDVAT